MVYVINVKDLKTILIEKEDAGSWFPCYHFMKKPFKNLGLSIPKKETMKHETIYVTIAMSVLTFCIFAVDSLATSLVFM